MPHRTIQTFTVAPLLLQLYVVLLADRFLLTHFYESLSWLPSHGDTYMYNMLLSVERKSGRKLLVCSIVLCLYWHQGWGRIPFPFSQFSLLPGCI